MQTYPTTSATSRVCAATGRAMPVGTTYYGAVIDEAGKLVRKDFSAEAWTGPPPGTIGYWRGRVPVQETAARPPINDELLVDCFEHLAHTTDHDRLRFRYVLGLLLMRRRRFRFEDTMRHGDREVLILMDAKSGTRHEVADPRLTADEMAAVQDEVFQVLGWA